MRPCKLMRLWSLPKGLQKMASSRVKSAGRIIFQCSKWPPAKMVRSQLPARTGEVLLQHCHDFDISENLGGFGQWKRARKVPWRYGAIRPIWLVKEFWSGHPKPTFYQGSSSYTNLLTVFISHWQILLLENHILKCPVYTNSIRYFLSSWKL